MLAAWPQPAVADVFVAGLELGAVVEVVCGTVEVVLGVVVTIEEVVLAVFLPELPHAATRSTTRTNEKSGCSKPRVRSAGRPEPRARSGPPMITITLVRVLCQLMAAIGCFGG